MSETFTRKQLQAAVAKRLEDFEFAGQALLDKQREHIAALEKENAELLKALEPFAQSANEIEARYGKDLPDGQFQFPELTMGDFRRARSALRDAEAEGRKG